MVRCEEAPGCRLLAQSEHRRVLNSCPLSPDVTRTAVPRDPTQGRSTAALAAMQAVAPSLRVEVEPVNMRDAGEIESAIAAFARTPNCGLVVTRVAARCSIANLIITLSSRYKLPAVYSIHSSPRAGGLISSGPDFVDQYRQAAGYVDRIGGKADIEAPFADDATRRASRLSTRGHSRGQVSVKFFC
jgi:hypothetical protein